MQIFLLFFFAVTIVAGIILIGYYLQEQRRKAMVAAARRFFNGNVRDYNKQVQMFPSNLVAGLFGFRVEDFFEIEDDAVRQTVKVSV
ncbi:MAG: LemA family protein [Planctomycetes bacterium]|nr:LemA family protein [Planctomycetota bacterium]